MDCQPFCRSWAKSVTPTAREKLGICMQNEELLWTLNCFVEATLLPSFETMVRSCVEISDKTLCLLVETEWHVLKYQKAGS